MSDIPYAMLANRPIGFGPYVQKGGQLHTFCVQGDIDLIDQFLDQMFKEPSDGVVDYEAAMATMFVSFAYFPSVHAMNPVDVNRGVLPERDAALWTLARRRGTLFEFRWIPLFLFVDSGSAMATGREVYGFPKQMGTFDMPIDGAPNNGPFRVSASVLNPYSPTTVAEKKPIFEFVAKKEEHGLLHEIEDVAEGVFSRIGEAIRDASHSEVVEALGGKSWLFDLPVTMAFLKQFPSTADQTKACFQSIVEADARTLEVRNGGWTKTEYTGRIFSYDSHPFHTTFGIPEGEIDVGHALFADFDFEMELGQDIWTAGAAGHAAGMPGV
ncbi:MAG: hypothetical protein AAFR79_06500 [Pseudomonadota bacterium]